MVTLVIIIGLISFSGIMIYRTVNKNKLMAVKQIGIEKFKDKKYNEAKEILDTYINNGGKSKEPKVILKIIDEYQKAEQSYREGDYEEVSRELSEIPGEYIRYKIVDDIQELERRNNESKYEEENFEKSSKNIDLKMYLHEEIDKNTKQLITVVSIGEVRAELILWEKDNVNKWVQKGRMLARLGVNGMKDASKVYEGDGCTPTGIYSLTRAFGHNENPGTKMPYIVLNGWEYWIDDPSSKYYNTMQFGEANGRWKSAEDLSEVGSAYNYVIVINYNMNPIVPGKSSAIFLHVDNGFPTQGCVAVGESKMKNILRWINPSDNPKITLAKSYDELKDMK